MGRIDEMIKRTSEGDEECVDAAEIMAQHVIDEVRDYIEEASETLELNVTVPVKALMLATQNQRLAKRVNRKMDELAKGLIE